MPDILRLVIASVSSVIVLFILAKLLGKKQIAQLEFIDYVVGISIGSIAAEMATDLTDIPIYYYIIAMAVFFLFDALITFLGRKGPRLKHIIKGRPILVVYEGKINFRNLQKSKLDVNDLLQLSREQGYFGLKDVAYAIFENSGKLSILPVGSKIPATKGDLPVPLEKSALPNHLIIDGEISYSGLNEINKDESWLYKQLGIKDKKELKNILLATFDSNDKTFSVHQRDE